MTDKKTDNRVTIEISLSKDGLRKLREKQDDYTIAMSMIGELYKSIKNIKT